VSKTVFILGAGASRQAKGPLMADFLDKARDLLDSGQAGEAEESFKLVFRARSQLKAVHTMAQLDIDNMESVFAAFEMAKILGCLGTIPPEEIEQLESAIRFLILRTLEKNIMFKLARDEVRPSEPYGRFVELINHVSKQKTNSASVITFNYDLALDYALKYYGIPFDYALSAIQTSEVSIPVLKLHGSLNWGYCDKCDKLSYWNLSRRSSEPCWRKITQNEAQIAFSGVSRCCVICNETLNGEPRIVPPTWNKTQHYKEIENVWQKAATELSEAENIFIIGYSWPENDFFFHYLYSLGTISDWNTYLRRIWIFNPDAMLKKRFEDILGQTAGYRFRYYKSPFGSTIKGVHDELINKRIDGDWEQRHRVL